MSGTLFTICAIALVILIAYGFFNKPNRLQVYLRLMVSLLLIGLTWFGPENGMPLKVGLSVVILAGLVKAFSDLRIIRRQSQMQVR